MNVRLILVVATIGLSALAHAGGMESGGGGAFVWRENGAPVRAQLVDLWESQNIAYSWSDGVHTLEISPDSGAGVAEQVQSRLDRLFKIDSGFANQVAADYKYLQANVNVLPSGIAIQLPEDLKLAYFPEGATPEGMMRFNGLTGKLDVNQNIFAKLVNNQNIAAAWLHESIYKTLRESAFAQRDSILSRHLNGCLFSADPKCLALAPPAVTLGKGVHCASEGAEFSIYQVQPSGEWRAEYQRLGESVFSGETYQKAMVHCDSADEPQCTLYALGPLHNALEDYGYTSGDVTLQIETYGLKTAYLYKFDAKSSLRGGISVPFGKGDCALQ